LILTYFELRVHSVAIVAMPSCPTKLFTAH